MGFNREETIKIMTTPIYMRNFIRLAQRKIGLLLGLSAVFFLMACEDSMIPMEGTETITLLRDGTISVSYAGKFSDTYDIVRHMFEAKGKLPPDFPTQEKATQDLLEKMKSFKESIEVTSIKAGIYQFSYTESKKLSRDELLSEGKNGLYPALLNGYELTRIFPPFVTLHAVDGGISVDYPSEAMSSLKDLRKEKNSRRKKKDEPDFSQILKLVQAIHGKVIIRTDWLVADQDANEVKKLADGVTEYTWNINYKNLLKTKFIAFLDEDGLQNYRLQTAAPGTSCQKLIGTHCQCGPFRLTDSFPMDEEKTSPTAYELHTPEKTFKGCTDKTGHVERVYSDVTGGCDLVKLPPAESALCTGEAFRKVILNK